LNEEPGIRNFWTTLWLIGTSGIHRVLKYSTRYSTEYSSSKKLNLHSPSAAASPHWWIWWWY